MRFFLLFALAGSLLAQLPAPNSMGVAMGHLHLSSTDVEAQRKFWVDFMGAKITKLGQADVYKFRDAIVVVTKKPSVTGGTDGSAVNHLGFKVKDLDAYKASCVQHGFVVERELKETRQAFVMGPDKVRVELSEDKTLDIPVAHHHIHFFNNAHLETQAWYGKMFGAKPGRRGKFDAADLPGVNLTFSGVEKATEPTKGRSVDHIGFEIQNLEQFVKELEAKGVKFDIPFRKIPALGLNIAFFTDPWGTYVELTEGLNKL